EGSAGIEDERGPRPIGGDRIEEEIVGEGPVGDVDDAGVQPAVDRDIALLVASEGPGPRCRHPGRGNREEQGSHAVTTLVPPPSRSSQAYPASTGPSRHAGQTGPRAAAYR